MDGKTTGLGMWEASENDTHRAIDMVSKDVVICDWHYERADPTAAIFALKGFKVITCPWRTPEVTRAQLKMMDSFRENSADQGRDRYYGFMKTGARHPVFWISIMMKTLKRVNKVRWEV